MRNQSMHSTPAQVMVLGTPAQGPVPEPGHLEAEHAQACAVVGHAEVAAMAGHHRTQELALLSDGSVHAPSELDLERLQFGAQAFGTGQAYDRELAPSRLGEAMRKAEEVKGRRFALAPAASVVQRVAPEL